MLQNNLELIVQFPENNGYLCRGFHGLHLASPVYVVFDGADVSDQAVANLLGMAFCQEVLRYAGVGEETIMPCRVHLENVYCHAMGEPTCRKILVRPAATGGIFSVGTWPTPCAEAKWLHNPSWEVIPVMPTGSSVQEHVPRAWQGINVCFWKQHPVEALWAVLQRAGLTPEENRIFISYVRKDATPVADQLFEALTKEGFDVFLDRYSVPIGVQFQQRLSQDLCDKAMVVLLNSKNLTQSRWVEEEIAIIKSYRLGLLELRFPAGKERRDIDSDYTRLLIPNDFDPGGSSYPDDGTEKLSESKLAYIVSEIKKVHGRALHRRRYELIDNFAAALVSVGKTATALPDGTFLLGPSGAGVETVVGLTVRPPELGDFCALHQRGNVSTGRTGWLISPSPLFLAQRQAQIAWLANISHIRHANEAQISDLAAKL